MDCLLCFKMFIGEMEFENYTQNPQVCKKAILKLFRISSDTGLQGLSEDLMLCLDCHRKLEDVEELVTKLEELQRKVDEARIEIKNEMEESKKVSEVMAKNFGDSMSRSSLDRCLLLKAIEGIEAGNTRLPAGDHDGIDFGGSNESSEGQDSQELADEPEIRDLPNEREGMLPVGATMLKELKICLNRVQFPPGVASVSFITSSSKSKTHKPTSTTQIGESFDEMTASDPGARDESNISSNGLAETDKLGGNQPKRAPGSINEFTPLENGTFQCKHCSKIFSNKNAIFKHLLIHGPRRFKCSRCGKYFSTSKYRNTHVKTVHERIRDFNCTWAGCGESFTNKSNLTRHVKVVHEGRRDLKCGGCGRAYATKFNLKQHMSSKHKKMGVAKKVEVDPGSSSLKLM